MRALLFATGYHAALEPLVSYRPSPLLRFADKPVIFHVIEALANQGIKQIDLILHHFPEQIEHQLGSGKRWGVEVCYHLVKDPARPFSMVKTVCRRWEEFPILIGQGDLLPKLPNLSKIRENAAAFFYEKDDWSGWGVIGKQELEHLPSNSTTDHLPELVIHHKKIPVEIILACRSLSLLMEGNRTQISKEKPDILFPTTAAQIEQGIWISRGVVIEPGVTITPPVFIGVESQIRSGSMIGPGAVIETLTLIDNHSHLENSLICQKSYVGENLEIKACIVDRNSLVNLEHGTVVGIQEQFILSDASLPSLSNHLTRWIERGLALLLFVLLSPIFLLLWTTGRTKQEEKLALPASPSRREWETVALIEFFPSSPMRKLCKHLPSLWQIVMGKLHFVGVPPRSPEEVTQMPQEWKLLYLRSKIGLITLERVNYGSQATVDEQYASEAYYAVHMGFLFDCKLFFRWMIRSILKY